MSYSSSIFNALFPSSRNTTKRHHLRAVVLPRTQNDLPWRHLWPMAQCSMGTNHRYNGMRQSGDSLRLQVCKYFSNRIYYNHNSYQFSFIPLHSRTMCMWYRGVAIQHAGSYNTGVVGLNLACFTIKESLDMKTTRNSLRKICFSWKTQTPTSVFC